MSLVTPDEMREMDRRTIHDIGLPGIVLMERAALGATDALLEHFDLPRGGRVGIICGGGNNGGDGLAMARMLAEVGVDVSVALLASRDAYRGDAKVNLEVADRLGLDVRDFSSLEGDALFEALNDLNPCDVWCDAIFGTGLDRPITGRFADAIAFLNESEQVFAVDIASGLSAMTGQVLGTCAPADHTATFGLPKLGHALYPGRALSGTLTVIDIGIPPQVESEVGATALWLDPDHVRLLPRPSTLHKGSAGRVLAIGGNQGMSGAILMAARAALHSGAGLLVIGSTARTATAAATALPEAMTAHVLSGDDAAPERVAWADVVVIGPGLGRDEAARTAFDAALSGRKIVVDADALHLLAAVSPDLGTCILTPHPGEAAMLLDKPVAEVLADSVNAARDIAARFDAVCVLKTAATVVAAPDGRLAINKTGNPGMATGGMGDALSGVLGSALCEFDDAFDAACVGVCVHGLAGDLAAESTGHRGLTVSALIDALPAAWKSLEPA